MRSQRTILLRRSGLILCFFALIAVGWTCLQMRFMAEESIHISAWLVAGGYLLCLATIGFGIFFANSHQIEGEKGQFISLASALGLLAVLLAALFIALAIDYPRAVEAREDFRQGGRPAASVVAEQLLPR